MLLSGVIQENREILFVIRAHPDEDRPGKESMETVAAWFETSGLRMNRRMWSLSLLPKR